MANFKDDAIDLADVVGGGNGFGSGQAGLGIDARTGKIQSRPFGALGNVKPGNFAKVSYDFVDGVFVPAAQETQISSTGLQAVDLPVHGGNAWDMIRNGPVASQFSTKLGAVDYASDGHSLLGLHANAGITFDVPAIRNQTHYGRLQFFGNGGLWRADGGAECGVSRLDRRSTGRRGSLGTKRYGCDRFDSPARSAVS